MKIQCDRVGVISTTLAAMLKFVLINKLLIVLLSLQSILEAGFAAAPNDLAFDMCHIDGDASALLAYSGLVLIINLGQAMARSSGLSGSFSVVGEVILTRIFTFLVGANIKSAFLINLAFSDVSMTAY